MQRRLASEGVWVEPASAAGVAGLAHELQAGRLDLRGKRVVAVCTGHGMKDPEIIAKSMPAPRLLPARVDVLTAAILGDEGMKLKIGVPATTANLGPGFDCLALTLDLWNEAEIEPAADFRVEVTGEGSAQLPTDENNLVIRAYLRCLESQGLTRPGGLHIRMANRIPIGSGLGSSASAVVMGILAANTLHELRMGMDEMIRLAAAMEGHADNAAAALLGGLVVISQAEEIIYQRFEIPTIQAVILVPDFPFPTREARAALPASINCRDAVFNLGRVPLVVHALSEGDLRCSPG